MTTQNATKIRDYSDRRPTMDGQYENLQPTNWCGLAVYVPNFKFQSVIKAKIDHLYFYNGNCLFMTFMFILSLF